MHGQVGFFQFYFHFPDAFQIEGFIDSSVRSMEIAIVPAIWSLGCDLLSCLAIRSVAIISTKDAHLTSLSGRLGPTLDAHVSRLVSVINIQLEQNPTSLVFSSYAFTIVFLTKTADSIVFLSSVRLTLC